MDFGLLVTQIEDREGRCKDTPLLYHKRKCKYLDKSPFGKLETSTAIIHKTRNLMGRDTPEFYVLLIDLFDRAILGNDLHVLSVEQEKLLRRWFRAGNTLTRQHLSAELQDYTEDELTCEEYRVRWYAMGREIQKLDQYLGSYLGEDIGAYARYYNKDRSNLTELRYHLPNQNDDEDQGEP